MKIVHRFSVAPTNGVVAELEHLGVQMIGTSDADLLLTFELTEDNPAWEQVASVAARYHAVDFVSTRFSKGELKAARRHEVYPSSHFAYPQPRDGHLDATYDLSDYCRLCGIGAKQKGPFLLRGEPKWGSRGISQLHFVFDEYFAKPEVWETVFRPLGVSSMPVLDVKTGRELGSVVQLVCDTVAKSDLHLEEYAFVHCQRCERRKYVPMAKGYSPRFRTEPGGAAMLRSKEYFGNGTAAFNAVFVTAAVYSSVTEAGVRGWDFYPQAGTEGQGARS